jgi:hypothetical protein
MYRLLINAFSLVAMLIIAMSFGCSTKRHEAERTMTTIQEADELIVPYFTADLDGARNALNQSIRFVENAPTNALKPMVQAEFLELDFERLYVLETKSGNARQADAALIKARYWRLQSLELNNQSDQEAIDIMKIDTAEKIAERVDHFDKGANGDKLPGYNRYLTASHSLKSEK